MYPKVAKVVSDVLRSKLKNGTTTKHDIKILAWKKIEKSGGPSKYGIGTADMIMAVMHIIDSEVTRQMRMPLTDHDAEFRLPPSMRADLKEIVVKIPRWIAIEEGPNALWMSTLKARAEHWELNGAMKGRKAAQTQAKADISTEVQMYLETHGFANLEEAIARS